jgi:hypothetical protein
MFLVVSCQGRIITVDDDGPVDFNNIQAAIEDSNNGDYDYRPTNKNRKNFDIID